MQKPRNSECLLTRPVHYAKATLALLGLILSCSLSAQDAGNTKTARNANIPKDVDAKIDMHSTDLATLTKVTLEQSIESARQRKLRELAEAVRAQLEGKTSAKTSAGLPIEKLPEMVAPNVAPRLWSLAASGNRVWAEVLLDGKIVQLDSYNGQLVQLDSDERTHELGSWTVLTLTEDGLVLGRSVKASGKKGKQAMRQERMLLRAPVRGMSVMTYQFAVPSALPDSVQRASQLPLFSGALR